MIEGCIFKGNDFEFEKNGQFETAEIEQAESNYIYATVFSPATPQRNFSRLIVPQLYLLC